MKYIAFLGNFESLRKRVVALNDGFPEIAGLFAALFDEQIRTHERLEQPPVIDPLRRGKRVVIMKLAAILVSFVWIYSPWIWLSGNGNEHGITFLWIWSSATNGENLSIGTILIELLLIAILTGIGCWLGEDAPIPKWFVRALGGNRRD